MSDETGELPVTVPSYADSWIKAAAGRSGLTYDLVACHVSAVSGFNPRLTSQDGRQGPYQFDPAVFYQVWHGSPFSWADATTAYGIYMTSLLRKYRGDVRQALAAFSYGEDQAAAHLEDAERIMECAGYRGLAFGGKVPAALTAAELTDPNVQSDDWSWYVQQSGNWLQQIGNTAQYWAGYIGGL